MWPSLVGHCVRDAGAARSNRAIPTIYYLTVATAAFGGGAQLFRQTLFTLAAPEITCRFVLCPVCRFLCPSSYRSGHLEYGQIHGNDHPPDYPTQKYHHKRLQ